MAINYELINKGGISLGTNFELLGEKPLDARLVVPSLDGLAHLIAEKAAYAGMVVYVTDEDKHYQVNADGTYRVFGITADELKDVIASETTAAMEFKGATAVLPENPVKGDMYKVVAGFEVDDEVVKVGDSIVYNGEQWFVIPSGDDIEDTWRPVTGVDADSAITFAAGEKIGIAVGTDGTVTYGHEAIDAPECVAANEQTRTYITTVETDGYGHITGYKTATENVVDTNTEYEFTSQVESSSVYFQVADNNEGSDSKTVYVDAYSKNETDAELAKKVDVETYNTYINGKSMSDDELKTYAKNYADGLAGNYDAAGSATTAESNAKAYADGLAGNYDAAGSAATAESNAKAYADGLAGNYDVAGSAATAESNAKAYADGLAGNYDKAGAASAAQAAAEKKAAELDAALKSVLQAEIDADVKVVNDAFVAYKSTNDAAVAGKVAQTTYDADKATFATKSALNDVNAKFAQYVTTASYTEDKTAINTAIEDRYTKSAADNKFAVKGEDAYNDTAVRGLISDNAEAIEAVEEYVGTFTHATAKTIVEYVNAKTDGIATSGNLEALAGRVTANEGEISAIKTEAAKHALKTEVEAVDAKFANYNDKTAQKAIDDEQDRRLGVIEGDYLKAADIANFETKANVKKVSDDLDAYKTSNDTEVAAVRVIAEAARTESEVNSQIDTKINALNLATTYEAIGAEDRAKAYVDGKFTDANLSQYTTEQEVKDIVDGVIAAAADDTTYNSLTKLVDYVDAHKGQALDMAEDITDHEARISGLESKPAVGITAGQISNWDTEVGAKALADTKLTASVFTEYSNAHANDYTNKQIDDAIDADVKAAIDAEVLRANGAYDAKGAAADAQAAAEATAAGALSAAKIEISKEIDADVKALADNVYTKTEVYTKAEVDALLTWGEF